MKCNFKLSVERQGAKTLLSVENFGDMLVSVDYSLLSRLDGKELNKYELEQLLDSLLKPVLEAGAKALGRRQMTRYMLEDKLIQMGYDELLVSRAADRLTELGGIDDVEFANNFALDRKNRGWGAVRIRTELRRRGVDDEDIAEAISQLGDPAEHIDRLISRRCKGREIDRAEANKIGLSLFRKGFVWEDIIPALAKYMNEDID